MRVWFCFFKQKTAYEMRISDWSTDVCSSDLPLASGLELGSQGTAQVGLQILDMLHADRHAYEVGLDAGRFHLCFRHGAGPHGGGMYRQGFHAAQADRIRRPRQCRTKAAGGIEAALDRKGDHGEIGRASWRK